MGTQDGKRPDCVITTLVHPELLVVLWLHTEVNPSLEEWDRASSQIVAWLRARGGNVQRLRQLVISDGGAPNTSQRSRSLHDVQGGQPSKIAVVTTVLSNPIKRGVATALTWSNPAIRFYEPAGMAEALHYLDIADRAGPVRSELENLEPQIGTIKTLRMIRWQDLL